MPPSPTQFLQGQTALQERKYYIMTENLNQHEIKNVSCELHSLQASIKSLIILYRRKKKMLYHVKANI